MVSFEPLPLVEFVLADCSAEEALRILKSKESRMSSFASALASSPNHAQSKRGRKDEESEDRLVIGNVEYGDDDDESGGLRSSKNRPLRADDPFARNLISLETGQQYEPIKVGRKFLETLDSSEVFYARPRWLRLILPDVGVHMCTSCNSFFHEDDWALESLRAGGSCPFCKAQ
jgi:hypothetical protein